MFYWIADDGIVSAGKGKNGMGFGYGDMVWGDCRFDDGVGVIRVGDEGVELELVEEFVDVWV